jgi:signal recognition particle subunit SRP54
LIHRKRKIGIDEDIAIAILSARPDVLNGSRRKRIALGSGTQVADVNRLVKQFDASRQMMKQLGGGKRMPGLPWQRGASPQR